MSKDKGVKNIKKPPADKTKGKGKVLSAYKSETGSGQFKDPKIGAFIPKPDNKSGGSGKS